MAGYGIADENNFGMHYWMLDVDMDCEQAFDDGSGRKWFELKAVHRADPGLGRRHHPDQQPDAALHVDQPHGHLRA